MKRNRKKERVQDEKVLASTFVKHHNGGWRIIDFTPTSVSFVRRIATYFIVFIVFHHFYWSLFVIIAIIWFCFWKRNVIGLSFLGIRRVYLASGTDYGQGSPWNWFLHSGFWKLLFEYFPLTVYQRVDYDSPPSKTMLVSCQPHGVMAVSRKLLYGYIWETLSFKQEGQLIMRRALAARPLFYIPLCRELTLWSGGIDASRDSALYSFQTGKSILVFPGGNREIFLTRKDEICTHIQKRKGFIKLALETGSSIVPVLAIGEEELFELFRMVPETIQERFLHNFRLPVGIAIGHFGTCMPKKVPLKIIVGKPISIARKTHPCIEQIDRTHAMYMERLRQLYEEFQLVFGGQKKPLIVK